jgi:hypothetical protein
VQNNAASPLIGWKRGGEGLVCDEYTDMRILQKTKDKYSTPHIGNKLGITADGSEVNYRLLFSLNCKS